MDNIHEKKIKILLQSISDNMDPAKNANLQWDIEELEQLAEGMLADIKKILKLVKDAKES